MCAEVRRWLYDRKGGQCEEQVWSRKVGWRQRRAGQLDRVNGNRRRATHDRVVKNMGTRR